MNKRMIWIVSAALLSVASMTAIASPHGMDKHPAHRSGHQHSSGQGAVAQLAKLEGALKLEEAQRPAWNAFVKDLQDGALARQKQRDDMREAMKKSKDTPAMGAIERMEAMGQRMQARQAHWAQMKQTTQTFLAQLSPAQQAVFNAQWDKVLGHKGRHHPGRSGHQDHHGSHKG